MTPAQAVLMIGGLASLLFGATAGFALYWLRLRDVLAPPPRYALITHTSAVTGGVVLIALSVVIPFSGLTQPITVLLAAAELLAIALANVRNLLNWRARIEDGIADVSPAARRLRGLVNVVHFVVAAALLYGVTRTALGV